MSKLDERLVDVYRYATLTRLFETTVSKAFAAGKIDGWIHSGLGQELAGSTLCALLKPQDYIVPYHRSKSYFLARGVEPGVLFAEIMGRAPGLCGGRGGEIHLASMEHGIFGTSGIIGATLPVALGAAYKQYYRKDDGITIVGFGDGGVAQGSFHECLNLAALWNLPVLFLCENNRYSEFTPLEESLSHTDIASKAQAYGMKGYKVDGYNPLALWECLKEAVESVRAGNGPVLVEVLTYRWHGHFEGDPESYRDKEEVTQFRERDPLPVLRQTLVDNGLAKAEELDAMEAEIEQQMEEALTWAEQQSFPTREQLLTDVYAD